jgi:hypothetical protein
LQVLERWHEIATVMLQQPQIVMDRSLAGIARQYRPIGLTRLRQLSLLMQRYRNRQGAAWIWCHAVVWIRQLPSLAW